jgi:thiamine transport system ATP-binding protein
MLELVDVRVVYGETVAVDGVSLTVGDHETVALLGPSGSGKSTLLRAICGLEPLSGGRIVLDGRDLAGVPVHERGFGLMFQDYVLFPQRDVRGNVAFGLEMRGDARDQIDARVNEVLALVGLSGYATRRITELSGGEQQRVALARSIAPTPRLVMLDEPLGALDRALRTRLIDELATIFRELRLPIVYVTHDQEEAFEVADRIVIMRDGRASAIDTPAALWSRPPDAWTAKFLGFPNVADADVEAGIAHSPWGDIKLGSAHTGRVTLVLRAEALSIDQGGSIHGSVSARTFRGDHVRVVVATDAGSPLELEVRGGEPVEAGQSVSVAVDPDRVNILSANPARAPRT